MSIQEKIYVLTTEEAVRFLRISKPTFLKYVRSGRIRAVKAGSGYRVLYPELIRFLNTPEENSGIQVLGRTRNPEENVKGLEDKV